MATATMKTKAAPERKPAGIKLTVEFDREDDGRFIAEVMELPGVMSYGATRAEALRQVEALALRVVSDKIEHGEYSIPAPLSLSFSVA